MNKPTTELKRCKQCGMLKDADQFRPYTYSKQTGTQGRYGICRACENLNTQYKRAKKLLLTKPSCSTSDPTYPRWKAAIALIEKMNNLYDLLAAQGYSPRVDTQSPDGTRKPSDAVTPQPSWLSTTDSEVDRLLAFYGHDGAGCGGRAQMAPAPSVVPAAKATIVEVEANDGSTADCEQVIPTDLQHWLTCDVSEWIAADLDPEYLQETIYESLKAKYRPQVGYDTIKMLPIYDDTYKDVLNKILRRFDDYEDMRDVECMNANANKGGNDDE